MNHTFFLLADPILLNTSCSINLTSNWSSIINLYHLHCIIFYSYLSTSILKIIALIYTKSLIIDNSKYTKYMLYYLKMNKVVNYVCITFYEARMVKNIEKFLLWLLLEICYIVKKEKIIIMSWFYIPYFTYFFLQIFPILLD